MSRRTAQDLVPCSSSRIRLGASHSSTDLLVVGPGRAPSSIEARRNHFCDVIGCTPKSVATCSIVTPVLTIAGHPDHITAELDGAGLGHGYVSALRYGTPDQLSPNLQRTPFENAGSGIERSLTCGDNVECSVLV